jgi:hypothetical protein
MIIFYNKSDKSKEPIGRTPIYKSRLEAAKHFAKIKNLELREFLKLFNVEKQQ